MRDGHLPGGIRDELTVFPSATVEVVFPIRVACPRCAGGWQAELRGCPRCAGSGMVQVADAAALWHVQHVERLWLVVPQ